MQTPASLSLSPTPDAVPQAMAWLEAVAEQEHWDPRTVFKLSLCLDEALTNIVMYGFTGRAGDADTPSINLDVLSDGKNIVLNLVDHGLPFDPTRSEEHTSELQSLMRTSSAVFC